jgi:transcriptional regulator with XRE-family HTH domain
MELAESDGEITKMAATKSVTVNAITQANVIETLKVIHTSSTLTPRELAARTDLDFAYIWRILAGTRRPSRDSLLKLCAWGWCLDLEDTDYILQNFGYPSLNGNGTKETATNSSQR